MADDTKAALPPYISFTTLVNLAERLEDAVPPRIDRSVLSYLSSGYRVQVLTTLRTLGLIDDSGVPSAEFQDLVTEPENRKRIVEAVWRRYYAAVLAEVDVARATADQLAEAFTKLGVTGDTRAKAMIFFVHGAKFADISVSALITNGIKRVRGTGARSRRSPAETATAAEVQSASTLPASSAPIVSVPLHPMLQGSIVWLAENGPTWTADDQEQWCTNFVSSVKLVYKARSAVRPESTEVEG
jgi:hypothetical protein